MRWPVCMHTVIQTPSAYCLQTFGRYDTAEAAAQAYDVGFILFRGPEGKLNHAVNSYLDTKTVKFHANITLPGAVAKAVQSYVAGSKRGNRRMSDEDSPGVCKEARIQKRAAMQRYFAFDAQGCPVAHESFLREAGIWDPPAVQ
jgi:hypothetical protein